MQQTANLARAEQVATEVLASKGENAIKARAKSAVDTALKVSGIDYTTRFFAARERDVASLTQTSAEFVKSSAHIVKGRAEAHSWGERKPRVLRLWPWHSPIEMYRVKIQADVGDGLEKGPVAREKKCFQTRL